MTSRPLRLARQMLLHRDPISAARKLGVRVGDRCRFIATSSTTFGSEPYLVSIGDHVTITEGVRFVTHDGGVWVLRDDYPDLDIIAPISVGNNVFIGMSSLILPGVHIGNNVVIAAGSLVTRDIPSDSVAAGIPAHAIKSLAEYRRSSLERGLPTKRLDPEGKKSYLIEHFRL